MSTADTIGLIFSIIVGSIILGSGIVWLVKGGLLSARDDAIRSNGIKTSAVIKEIKRGGRALGNEFNPAVKLRVLVENEKGDFYPAQIETTISVTHIPQFQPGAIIDVAYDPADPTKVTVLSPTD